MLQWRIKPGTIGLVMFALIAGSAGADEWRALDGFIVRTADDIMIDAPDDGESEFFELVLEGSDEPDALVLLIPSDPARSDSDAALLAAIENITLQIDDGERLISVATSELADTRVGGALALGIRSTERTWSVLLVPIGETPGGHHSYLIVIPYASGQTGTIFMRRLLEDLEIEVTDAAG